MADAKRDLQATARQIGGRMGFTPEQLSTWMGLIDQESNWDPNAVGPETRKYGKAKGLGQLIDATAKRFGVKDSFDPLQNLQASAKYFKQLNDEFGDIGLALAAYNWGEGNVRGLIQNPSRYTIPDQTANYVPSVMQRASKFGPTAAPSTATLAFFPGSTKAVKGAVDKSVRERTGSAPAGDVTAKIATAGASMSPAAASMTAPQGGGVRQLQGGPGRGDEFMPGMVPPGPDVPSVGSAAATGLPKDPLALNTRGGTADMMARTERAPQAKTLSDFLRTQFGPVADLADPLPKQYDSELRRIIDEA